MKDDYQNPIAVPLMYAVLFVIMIVVNVGDALAGDRLSAFLVIAAAAAFAWYAHDLFKRFQAARRVQR